MKVVSSESIVLRQRDFKDRDRLVTFLTRDKGKLTGIAKGVKILTGRGVGSYEPFTRCVMYYAERPSSDLVHIRKCDIAPPYLYLHPGYDKFLYLSYFTELIEMGPVGAVEAPALFDLLARVLARAAEAEPADFPSLRLEFELDWLHCAGLEPEWRHCLECGEPIFAGRNGALHPRRLTAHQFDVPRGGLRCPNCRRSGAGCHDLLPGALAGFAAWRWPAGELPAEAPRLAGAVLRDLQEAVSAHLLHHLERRPRSLALLPGGEGAERVAPAVPAAPAD